MSWKNTLKSLIAGNDVPVPERQEPNFQNASEERKTHDLSTLEGWHELVGMSASHSGVVVNSDTAMRTSAVFACVSLISGSVGDVPLKIYGKDREAADDHPYADLLRKSPNRNMAAGVWLEMITTHNMIGPTGDSYTYILRNRNGDVEALLPVDPRCCNGFKKNGELVYQVTLDDGVNINVHQDDMLHVPGVGFNGIHSMSRIKYAAFNAVGIAIAAEEFSARFFANDATPRGVIEYEKGFKDENGADKVRDYWLRHHGDPTKRHLPAILSNGGKYKPITLSAEDTQLMDVRGFQVLDIARAFDVPPHMIGALDKNTSWGTGIEQQTLGFVQFSLRSYLRRIEQEINRKIFRGPEHRKYRAEFNLAGLLRADSKTRSEYYRAALGGAQGPGWMSVNDVRWLENLPKVEGGDEIFKPESTDAAETPVPDAPKSPNPRMPEP